MKIKKSLRNIMSVFLCISLLFSFSQICYADEIVPSRPIRWVALYDAKRPHLRVNSDNAPRLKMNVSLAVQNYIATSNSYVVVQVKPYTNSNVDFRVADIPAWRKVVSDGRYYTYLMITEVKDTTGRTAYDEPTIKQCNGRITYANIWVRPDSYGAIYPSDAIAEVAAHEIGHALGMGHAYPPEPTLMLPASQNGAIMRPQPFDVRVLRNFYYY